MTKKRKPPGKSPEHRRKIAEALTLYPWVRWFSKRRVRLRQGVDYQVGTGSMMGQIRTKASGYGVSVSLFEGTDHRGTWIMLEVKNPRVNK